MKIFYKTKVYDRWHDSKEVTTVGAWPVVTLLVFMTILLFSAVVNKGETNIANANYAQALDYNRRWEKKSEGQDKIIADLTTRYEALQCSTRGLVITTVKGITLCMNAETKALHKIDEKAD